MRNIGVGRRTLAGLSGATIRRAGAGWLVACAIAAAIGAGLFAARQQFELAASPAAAPGTIAMRSYPLGIDLPAGADRATLPAGLTDYLRPGAREAGPQAIRSYPLGIDLPAGADPATLPSGLTDYLRPER